MAIRTKSIITFIRGLLYVALISSALNVSVMLGLDRGYEATASLEIGWPNIIFKTSILLICALAFLMSWLSLGLDRRMWPFIAFFIWGCLVWFCTGTTLIGIRQLASFLTSILFLLAASRVFDVSKDLGILKKCLFGAVILLIGAGILQNLLGHGPAVGTMVDKWDVHSLHTGAGSVLQQTVIPITSGLIFISSFIYTRKKLSGLVGTLLIILGSLVLLRGVILGLCVGLASLFLVGKLNRVRYTIILFLIIGLLTIIIGPYVYRKSFTKSGYIETHGRMKQWPVLLEYALEKPLLGHGPNSDLEYFNYIRAREFGVAHNEYLGLFVSFGVPGLLLYIAGIVCLFWRTIKLKPLNSNSIIGRNCSIAVLSLLMVAAMFGNLFRQPGVMIALFVFPAACIGSRK